NEECLSFSLELLRGNRRHTRRINCATETTGDWHIGKTMFFRSLVDQTAHLSNNLIGGRNKCLARGPVSPHVALSLPCDGHRIARGQGVDVRVKKIFLRASSPL